MISLAWIECLLCKQLQGSSGSLKCSDIRIKPLKYPLLNFSFVRYCISSQPLWISGRKMSPNKSVCLIKLVNVFWTVTIGILLIPPPTHTRAISPHLHFKAENNAINRPRKCAQTNSLAPRKTDKFSPIDRKYLISRFCARPLFILKTKQTKAGGEIRRN